MKGVNQSTSILIKEDLNSACSSENSEIIITKNNTLFIESTNGSDSCISFLSQKRVADTIGDGRWTDKEHKLFVDAVLSYGNNWKAVESLIGTRSSSQIRSHSQKFFIKLQKFILNKEWDASKLKEAFKALDNETSRVIIDILCKLPSEKASKLCFYKKSMQAAFNIKGQETILQKNIPKIEKRLIETSDVLSNLKGKDIEIREQQSYDLKVNHIYQASIFGLLSKNEKSHRFSELMYNPFEKKIEECEKIEFLFEPSSKCSTESKSIDLDSQQNLSFESYNSNFREVLNSLEVESSFINSFIPKISGWLESEEVSLGSTDNY